MRKSGGRKAAMLLGMGGDPWLQVEADGSRSEVALRDDEVGNMGRENRRS